MEAGAVLSTNTTARCVLHNNVICCSFPVRDRLFPLEADKVDMLVAGVDGFSRNK